MRSHLKLKSNMQDTIIRQNKQNETQNKQIIKSKNETETKVTLWALFFGVKRSSYRDKTFLSNFWISIKFTFTLLALSRVTLRLPAVLLQFNYEDNWTSHLSYTHNDRPWRAILVKKADAKIEGPYQILQLGCLLPSRPAPPRQAAKLRCSLSII